MTKRDIRSSDARDLDPIASPSGTEVVPVEVNGDWYRLTAQQIANLGGGSSGGVGVANVSITSVQLKNLLAAPIQLAPMVVGKRYGVLSWFLRFHAGATPYSYATGGPRTILMVGPQSVVTNNESNWELFDSGLDALFLANTNIVTQFAPSGMNTLSENLTPGSGISDPLVFGNAGTVNLSAGDGTLDVGVVYALLAS